MSIHIPSGEGEAVMAEVRASMPEALPVLPLRDSVPFPETLTPLAGSCTVTTPVAPCARPRPLAFAASSARSRSRLEYTIVMSGKRGPNRSSFGPTSGLVPSKLM